MSKQTSQNPSSSPSSLKKQSRLPIFRSSKLKSINIATPSSSQIPVPTSTPKYSKIKSEAKPIGKKVTATAPPSENLIKSQVKPVPRKSFLPVKSNHSPKKPESGIPSPVQNLQPRARTQIISKPTLRPPSVTVTDACISKPSNSIKQIPTDSQISRQQTFAGDATGNVRPPSEELLTSDKKPSKSLLKTNDSENPLSPPKRNTTGDEPNMKDMSSQEMDPYQINPISSEVNHYFPCEGQLNNSSNCSNHLGSNVQDKLPKSAGYESQNNEETTNSLTTTSSHSISPKNHSRFSYTLKTKIPILPCVENHSSDERRDNYYSFEKVTPSEKVTSTGIIETKSPSFMESSDSSDIEVIEFLNEEPAMSDTLDDVYVKLAPTYSQIKHTGIIHIEAPTLQSSEEVRSTLSELPPQSYEKSSISNQNNSAAMMSVDSEIVETVVGYTEENVVASTAEEMASLAAPVISSTENIELPEALPPEVEEIAIDSKQFVRGALTSCQSPLIEDQVFTNEENVSTSSPQPEPVREPALLPTNNEEGTKSSEINECASIHNASTTFDVMRSSETQINDCEDKDCRNVTSNSANGDNNKNRQSAQIEDIMSPRSRKKCIEKVSLKYTENNSTNILKSSEALPSENSSSSTISLRQSEGLPFAVSSMSLQVARLLSHGETLQHQHQLQQQERPRTTIPAELRSAKLEAESKGKTEVLEKAVTTMDIWPKSQKSTMTHAVVETSKAQEFKKHKSHTRPYTSNEKPKEATTLIAKQRSRSSKQVESLTQTYPLDGHRKLSYASSSSAMLMHGCGSFNESPCLSCRTQTYSDYDNNNREDGKKCKTVYFNPDMLPRSSRQINGNRAAVCLRKESSQDQLPLHFSHLVIDSTVSMYSVGSHLEGYLRIQNNSPKNICYRVTSCIPGRYQLIPSSGLLEKNRTVALTIASVIPKTFIKFEPDQFQIETVVTPPDVITPIEQRLFWKEVNPTQIQKALVGRVRVRNPSDMRFEVEEKSKQYDSTTTSYGDGVVVRRMQKVRSHPPKQGVADICICTIILGILAAAIHRFSSSLSDY